MAIAPDGHTLAVAAESADFSAGTVRLWDISGTPHLERRLPLDVPDSSVNVVAFADAGREVVAGTGSNPPSGKIAGGYLVGWNTADGARSFTPMRFAGRVIAQLGISPAGTLAAVGLMGADDTQMQLVDLARDQLVGSPVLVPGSLSALGFADDGSLITGDFNGMAQRWSTPALRPLGQPELTGGGAVGSVATEPDAPFYLTTNFDGTTKLWNLGSGQEVGTTFTPQLNTITSASVTPDGGVVSVASQLGTVWTFPLSPQGWMRDACAVAGRNLTATEWAQFVGDRPYQKVCPQYATPSS